MRPDFWIVQTFNGLSYGALLFLLASGLSLIFGVMRIVNMAHGSYFMLGGYLGLTVALRTRSFAMAVLAAMAAQADREGTWITAIDDPCLPVHYATVNLWHYLGRGLGKRWISMSTAQTGDTEDFLRAGRALGADFNGVVSIFVLNGFLMGLLGSGEPGAATSSTRISVAVR